MVRIYIKKSNRQSWSTDAMNKAVDAVIGGQMTYLVASNRFGVPCSTLERYVKKRQVNPAAVADKSLGKYKSTFTADQEIELVAYLKNMQKQLFGVTTKELRILAYQLAERNNCEHKFNKTLEMAGQDWASSFLKRHPELSLRKPKPPSGFYRENVSSFFNLLNEILDKYELHATRIFNCAKTSISVIPEQISKIITDNEKCQDSVISYIEKDTTVQVVICCSAAGSYMPPMLVFPRKKKQRHFEIGLPLEGWAEVNEIGGVSAEIFLKWFQKFIIFSKATKEHPVLLLLDGHALYTKNLTIVDLARNNGVITLCFPPNCSHKLQPLNDAFMKPFTLHYEDEVTIWLESHPGRMVELLDISTIFGQAFLSAANMRTAINAFEKTGIWPSNINVFTNDDFLPTDLKNTVQRKKRKVMTITPAACAPAHHQVEDISLKTADKRKKREEISITPIAITPAHQQDEVYPIPVALISVQTNIPIDCKPGSSRALDSPDCIKANKQSKAKARTKRVQRKSPVLPASSDNIRFKERIKNRQNTKSVKEETIKKLKHDIIMEVKEKNAIKNESKEEIEIIMEVKQENMKQRLIKKEKSEDEEGTCLYRCNVNSMLNKGWCNCKTCQKWARMACEDLDSDDESVFICQLYQ